jgi:ribonuclease Z
MTTFSVTVLGSGAAIPMIHRNPSSHLLNVHEKLYLLDCAESTQVQLRKNRIRFQRINHIFITHLHGDHYFGLIGLITTYHLLGREKELHLYAHPDLKKIIDLQLESSKTVLRYPLIFHEINPEVSELIHEDTSVTVETIPLEHNFPTCGFIFREKMGKRRIDKDFLDKHKMHYTTIQKIKNGADYTDDDGNVYPNKKITTDPLKPRSYAYVTDTAYNEAIIPVIKNTSLLYHEATFMEDKAKDATEKFHSTAKQAARIAKKAKVEQLLLGHYSARYKYITKIQAEATTVFSNTIMADDGKIITVSNE